MSAKALITYGQLALISSLYKDFSELSPFGLVRDVEPSGDSGLFSLGILDRVTGRITSEFSRDIDTLANPDLFTSVAIGEGSDGAVLSFYTDTDRDPRRRVGLHLRADDGFVLQTGVDSEHICGWVDSFTLAPGSSNASSPPFCDMTLTSETTLVFFSLIDQLVNKLSTAEDLDFPRDEIVDTIASSLEGDLDTFAGLAYTMVFKRDRHFLPTVENPGAIDELISSGILVEGESRNSLCLSDSWLKGFLGMSVSRPRYFSIHADRIIHGGMCSGSLLAIEAAGAFIFVEPGLKTTESIRLTIAGPLLVETLFKGILHQPEKWLNPGASAKSGNSTGDGR